MYSQGNYGSQCNSTVPPPLSSYQQGSAAPALYQQGFPAPPYQQGPLTPLPAALSHAPPASTPVHQGHLPPVHVTPPGVLNAGQPSFNQAPPLHGSSSMASSYQLSHQTSYAPYMQTHNVHHAVTPVPLQSGQPLSGPSPPFPRFLPPPPSTSQMSYRTLPPPPPPPLNVNMQGPQPIRPPAPLVHSSFVPITPAASVSQASVGEARPPSTLPPPPPLPTFSPPPPPPSSPPPLSPSPPPPSSPVLEIGAMSLDTSSLKTSILEPAFNMPDHLESSGASDKVSNFMGSPIEHADKSSIHAHLTEDLPPLVITSVDKGPQHMMSSSMEDDASPSKANALSSLRPPPPKPVEEDVVRNIEVLCQFIAKVGPAFESLARTKEAENPKFAFLVGGEPGSAAAIGHEYFLWMKQKCEMEFKLQNESERRRPLEIESFPSPVSPASRDASLSPELSDMDMEDDVVQPENDHKIYQADRDSYIEPVSVGNEAPPEDEQVHYSPSPQKEISRNAITEIIHSSQSPQEIAEQKEDDLPRFSRLDAEDLSPIDSPPSDARYTPSGGCLDPANTLTHVSSQVNVSLDMEVGNNGDVPRVYVKDGSPFRLIQGYASDDSEEDGKTAIMEDVNPVKNSEDKMEVASNMCEEEKIDICPKAPSETISEIEMRSNISSSAASETIPEIEARSNISSSMPEVFQHSDAAIHSHELVHENLPCYQRSDKIEKLDEPSACEGQNITVSDSARSEKVLDKDLLHEDAGIHPPSNETMKNADVNHASNTLNVDEFGRLVREGISDSDSDELHYSRRFGKRGRSPSPQEGRRRRRRDRRSRSRSWSPKKQGRSGSPLPQRHVIDFVGEKARRDVRGQPPECFDFLRGKCYRGASCKYVHHDFADGNASKRNRNKREQHLEVLPHSNRSVLHGDSYNVAEAHHANIMEDLSPDGHELMQEKGKTEDMETNQDIVNDSEAKSIEEYIQKADSCNMAVINAEDSIQSQGSQEAHAVATETQGVQVVDMEQSISPKDDEDRQKSDLDPLPADTKEAQPFSAEINGCVQGGVIAETEATSNDIPCTATQELRSDIHPVLAEGVSSSSPTQTSPLTASSHQTTALSQHLVTKEPPVSAPVAPVFVSQDQPISSQVDVSQPFPSQVDASQPFPSQVDASQPIPPEISQPALPNPREFSSHNFSSGDFKFQPSQLPPPPPLPYAALPRGILNVSNGFQPPTQYQLQPPVSSIPSQPFAAEAITHRPNSFDHLSQRAAHVKPTWGDLPSPMPPHFVNELTHRPSYPPPDAHPSQYHQNLMPARGNMPGQPSVKNPLSEELNYSTFSSYQHPAVPHIVNTHRASLQMELMPRPLDSDIQWSRPLQGSSFMKVDRFAPPMLSKSGDLNPRTIQDYHLPPPRQIGGHALDMGAALSRAPIPFPKEPISIHRHFMSTDDVSARSFSREDFGSHPRNLSHTERHHSSYDSQIPIIGSFPSHSSMPNIVDQSFSRYSSGLSEVGSKISTSSHYNPFASTFEQAPSSKFVSSVLSRELDSNFGSKLGRELTSGDQYDPLFDSIEPPSNQLRRLNSIPEKGSTLEVVRESALRSVSGTIPSGSHMPLDVEENNKKNEGTVAIKPLEHDDMDGAATDAEIGAVENESPRPGEGKSWSPGIANDITNTVVEEIEIDQVQVSGKSKKNKDSRSLKLFKIAIADFVKEVLKPSWRQGNMSKEAFKTIVKKTVDKVSGAMQSHQIPKSQSKINQYVESSRRKLTKLVMGYVDKYVKV